MFCIILCPTPQNSIYWKMALPKKKKKIKKQLTQQQKKTQTLPGRQKSTNRCRLSTVPNLVRRWRLRREARWSPALTEQVTSLGDTAAWQTVHSPQGSVPVEGHVWTKRLQEADDEMLYLKQFSAASISNSICNSRLLCASPF